MIARTGSDDCERLHLAASPILKITTTAAWEAPLKTLGITSERHRRIATEGALLGGLLEKGLSRELVIVSDGAGQFAILLHALCWVHAERLIHKLIPLNDQHRLDQQRVRDEIWTLYADLKAYQRAPDPPAAAELRAHFEAIFRLSWISGGSVSFYINMLLSDLCSNLR